MQYQFQIIKKDKKTVYAVRTHTGSLVGYFYRLFTPYTFHQTRVMKEFIASAEQQNELVFHQVSGMHFLSPKKMLLAYRQLLKFYPNTDSLRCDRLVQTQYALSPKLDKLLTVHAAPRLSTYGMLKKKLKIKRSYHYGHKIIPVKVYDTTLLAALAHKNNEKNMRAVKAEMLDAYVPSKKTLKSRQAKINNTQKHQFRQNKLLTSLAFIVMAIKYIVGQFTLITPLNNMRQAIRDIRKGNRQLDKWLTFVVPFILVALSLVLTIEFPPFAALMPVIDNYLGFSAILGWVHPSQLAAKLLTASWLGFIVGDVVAKPLLARIFQKILYGMASFDKNRVKESAVKRLVTGKQHAIYQTKPFQSEKSIHRVANYCREKILSRQEPFVGGKNPLQKGSVKFFQTRLKDIVQGKSAKLRGYLHSKLASKQDKVEMFTQQLTASGVSMHLLARLDAANDGAFERQIVPMILNAKHTTISDRQDVFVKTPFYTAEEPAYYTQLKKQLKQFKVNLPVGVNLNQSQQLILQKRFTTRLKAKAFKHLFMQTRNQNDLSGNISLSNCPAGV